MSTFLRTFGAALLLASLGTQAQEEATATNPYVRLDTTQGPIYLELYRDKAPKTVENFLQYVEDGYYAGTIFHRVIPNFMIQGGGFTTDLQKKQTREPIPNEADNMLSNKRGTIAMARTADPHSGTSQFFINVVDNPALDHSGKTHSRAWGYAVFGEVVRGMDAVDAIRSIPTGPRGPFRSDVPTESAIIEGAEVVDALPPEPQPEPEAAAAVAEESEDESTEN